MDNESLLKKLAELETQQQIMLANYHRVSGAIALLKQLLETDQQGKVKEPEAVKK